MSWRYTTPDNVAVTDGANVSRSIKDPEIQEYIAKGGVIDAYVAPPKSPDGWTPYQIVNALEKMGVAEAILSKADEITKAKFFAGSFILETEPLLIGALNAVGKTIDDLKKVAIEA